MNKNSNETKTLHVRVYIQASYESEIQVPANLDKRAAFEYAKDHIDEIKVTDLDYLPNSDNIDDEDFDQHFYFVEHPIDDQHKTPNELIKKLIDRARELEHTVMASYEEPEIGIHEETNMIEIRRYDATHQNSYPIEDFCTKSDIDMSELIKNLDKSDMYYVL